MRTTNLSAAARSQMHAISRNLKRIMIDRGLTVEQVVSLSGLNEQTVRSIRDAKRHTRTGTLNMLATGLGVEARELLEGELPPEALFDRATNPLVAAVVDANPRTFKNWTGADFDELRSNRGHGGSMTDEGVLAIAKRMNEHREVVRKVKLVLQTRSGAALRSMVEQLYKLETSVD